jgi:hypothetical protein
VGGNLWFAVSAIRLRGERDRVRAEQVSAERPPQSSSDQPPIAPLTLESSEHLEQAVRERARVVAELERRLAEHPEVVMELERRRFPRRMVSSDGQPQPERIAVPLPPTSSNHLEQAPSGVARTRVSSPTFVLMAGELRAQLTNRRLAIPSDAQTIRLRLKLPADDYPMYRVVFLHADGEEIGSLVNLKADRRRNGLAVVAVLASELLARGDYQVRLSGKTAKGQWDDIATYPFRVTPVAPSRGQEATRR